MRDNKWQTAAKGGIIGATMIVPGVSGGTMAMILGIYDQLISAVSSFRRSIKENFLFLVMFAFGAGSGLLLFSTPLSWLLKYYPTPTLYFFIGAVVGGIPLIEKKSGIQKVSLEVVLYMLLGAALVLLISRIPTDVLNAEASKGAGAWLILLVAGIVSAAALILPGISFSHFLLILGLYDGLLNALKTLDLTFLLPLGFGVLGGIILLSKLLENFMKKFPKQTYLMILGFIIGSVAEIFPGFPQGGTFFICTITAMVGFFVTYRRNYED